MSNQDKSGDQIFAELEGDTSTHQYRGDQFKKCAEAYAREGRADLERQMMWEMWAFELQTRSEGDGFFGGTRFSSLMSARLADGHPFYYPNPDLFTEEVLAYYERRAQETPNPIHRARYYDILWESRRDHQFARSAFEAYLECVPIDLRNAWGLELADALDRAKALALQLNDRSLKERVIRAYFETLEALRARESYRWYLEPLRSLLDTEKKLPVDIGQVIGLAEEAAAHFAAQGDFWLERMFLEVIEDAQRGRSSEEAPVKAKIRRAESLERQAAERLRRGDALVAVTFLRDALQFYVEVGTYPEKVEEIKVRLKAAGEQAAEHMKPISVTIPIPQEMVEDIPAQLRSLQLQAALNALSAFTDWIPGYERARNRAEEQAKQYVLQHLATTVIFSEDNPALEIHGEEEKLEYGTLQEIRLAYRLFAEVRMPAIVEVLKEKGVSPQSFVQHLSRSNVFTVDRLKLIERGLERYLASDWVSTLHILVLQIEGVIRDIARTLGLPTTSFSRGRVQERQLQDLLEDMDIVQGLGKDFTTLLKTFLADITGDNLRHQIAHALLKYEEFQKWHCDLVLMILLRLAGYTIRQTDQA